MLLIAPLGQAEIIYKGDGTPGGLIPDFPQDCGQKVKGVCAAAAVADSIWWFDQHGYPGIVKHKDPAKPNDTWKEDSKRLVIDLAERIYGKQYVQGKETSTRNGRGTEGAIMDYLKDKGVYDGQKKDGSGLTVRYFDGAKATYDKWESELRRSEDLIGRFTWRDKDGKPIEIKDPADPKGKATGKVVHAMTGGGIDTEKKKLIVANPWGNHPGNKPPYDKSYFDEYEIEVDAQGRVKIPKKAGVNLFGYDADHITLDGFWDVSPGQGTNVRDSVKPGKTPNTNEYSYEVENLSFEPIFQFALEVQVPFDDISAPFGWNFDLWDPTLTPDVTPAPPQLKEPGQDQDPGFSEWDSAIDGILWSTTANPIMPGSSLDGFTFEVSDIFPHGEFAAMAGLSDGLSGFLDSTSSGLVTEFVITSGPMRIPEPTTAALVFIGLGWVGIFVLKWRSESSKRGRNAVPGAALREKLNELIALGARVGRKAAPQQADSDHPRREPGCPGLSR